jgi:hypothetical protein
MRQEKQKAISLRKKGRSYNEISRILDVSKSTLSLWLKNVKMPPEIEKRFWDKTRKKWSESITAFNKKQGEIAKNLAGKRQRTAAKEIRKLSKRELLLIGVALYWAEGYKKNRWAIHFTNSDPEMIKVMIRFLKEICGVPELGMRAAVQIHPNTTSAKAINYWSKVTGISKKNFCKTYLRVSPSSKGKRPINTLPYGTLRIGVYNIEIADRIKGWIRGVSKHI